MRQRMTVAALLAAALAAFPAAAQEEPKASHPCKQVVSCDCESIEAGILSGGWKTDCRNCEKGIHEACMQAYADGRPLFRAMVAGGYCSNACSVTGDHPKPLPPPDAGAAPDPADTAPPRPAILKLRCPFEEEWTSVEEGGKVVSGCMKDGMRNGLWLSENPETGEVTEVLYEDGREVWRRSVKPGTE